MPLHWIFSQAAVTETSPQAQVFVSSHPTLLNLSVDFQLLLTKTVFFQWSTKTPFILLRIFLLFFILSQHRVFPHSVPPTRKSVPLGTSVLSPWTRAQHFRLRERPPWLASPCPILPHKPAPLLHRCNFTFNFGIIWFPSVSPATGL